VILVDDALERRERQGCPIRVALVGAGFMGRGIALQILRSTRGMRLVAISSRRIEAAREAYRLAGVEDLVTAGSTGEVEAAIARDRFVVSEDPHFACQAEGIDAVIEVTGSVDFGARVALSAFQHGKHLVLMNAELDGTLGPILKTYADSAGVVFTNCDGDQPAVQMNLYRFVRGIGMRPVLCSNIKGLQDPYRTPITQEGFARRWGQKPDMVTSFADGTKISFEQAIVANATGMRVARRGMIGPVVPAGSAVEEAASWFPHDALRSGPGIVDYVVGAAPAPGVFVLATQDHPVQRRFLELYKLGEGPFYCFVTPYHLCHFEAPISVARAVLFGDAAIAPLGPPLVDVVATTKTGLSAGTMLDGMGGFTLYGQCENSDLVHRERLLPMGLAEGARLLREVPRDTVLSYDDVELPETRLADRLRAEQDARFDRPQAASGT
jgi:predicted homoserine dehydrogenase-like protein